MMVTRNHTNFKPSIRTDVNTGDDMLVHRPAAARPVQQTFPMADRPWRPRPRRQSQPVSRRLKDAPEPVLPESVPVSAKSQRKPLYDRLLDLLARGRSSEAGTIDAELKLVALYDDPGDITKMSKSQIEELTKLALQAETFQSTLLAASLIEEMTEEQADCSVPILNNDILRFVLDNLREKKNWRRLLGLDGLYLDGVSIDSDLLLQAYGVIIDNAYQSWKIRCRYGPRNGLDEHLAYDEGVLDGWMDLWSHFFTMVDRYTAAVASRIGPEAFSDVDITESRRVHFLNDLLRFIGQLRNPNENAVQIRAANCFRVFAEGLGEAVKACVVTCYESRKGLKSAQHFDDILSTLTSRCLQAGPKLLAKSQNYAGDANWDNVSWKVEGVVLTALLDAFQIAKNYRYHPIDPVIKPNIANMFDKVLFQVSHNCVGESSCSCYARSPSPALMDVCELFLCDTVADRFPFDFAPRIDAFVAYYRAVPNDRWIKALLTVYPSAKKEVTKYFSMFAELESLSQRQDSFRNWRPIALSLMVKISSDNAKLFDAKLIKNIETVFFSKTPILSFRALLILKNVAANNPRVMLGCGKDYYNTAGELPDVEVAPMSIVNETLRNIGLQNEEEAERVMGIMETEIRQSQDKPFIEDVLRQWHYIAIVYQEPVEARRSLINEYRQDPLLCKAAYEVFSLASGQQTKATACSLM